MKRAALLLLAVTPLFADEYAVLKTGFRIAAERHDAVGTTTRLYTKQGTVELPTASIDRFEQDDYTPGPPRLLPGAETPAVTQPSAQPATVTPVAPAAAAPAAAAAKALPVPQSDVAKLEQLIREAAVRHGLKPEFVLSVATVESAMKSGAISPKGAVGAMQLMPGTAAHFGVNAADPKQNVEAGARYLKELLIRYKDRPDWVRLALAAYNAGPATVDRYRSIPPYRETVAYVEKVITRYLAQSH